MVCLQTKNSNLGKFSRALDWKNGYTILCPFGIFCGHLRYFLTIWYILCSFGTFLSVLVSWTNKNLATLAASKKSCKSERGQIFFGHVQQMQKKPGPLLPRPVLGCQMVCFQNKNTKLGKL
jgi:hypothetical protein